MTAEDIAGIEARLGDLQKRVTKLEQKMDSLMKRRREVHILERIKNIEKLLKDAHIL